MVIDAYLQGFEPLEPRLRGRDPEGTREVEAGLPRPARGDGAGRRKRRGPRPGHARSRAASAAWPERRPRSSPSWPPSSSTCAKGSRQRCSWAPCSRACAGWGAATPRATSTRAGSWPSPRALLTFVIFDRVLVPGRRPPRAPGSGGLPGRGRGAVLRQLLAHLQGRFAPMDVLPQGAARGVALARATSPCSPGSPSWPSIARPRRPCSSPRPCCSTRRTRAAQVFLGALLGLVAVGLVALVMSRTVLRLPLGPFFGVSGLLLCALAVAFAGSGLFELVAAGYLVPAARALPRGPVAGHPPRPDRPPRAARDRPRHPGRRPARACAERPVEAP